MAMPKEKNPDGFAWRSNSIQEKRQKRKKRNKKKKRKCAEKRRKLKEQEIQANLDGLKCVQSETMQYKRLSAKYLGLWKCATQQKDDKIN